MIFTNPDKVKEYIEILNDRISIRKIPTLVSLKDNLSQLLAGTKFEPVVKNFEDIVENILNIKQKYKNYWKNPWPDFYNHLIDYKPDDDWVYMYEQVKMKNWSNNPSLTKAKVYHQGFFEHNSHYEVFFADKFGDKINQYFTDHFYFYHSGNKNSLEEHQRT